MSSSKNYFFRKVICFPKKFTPPRNVCPKKAFSFRNISTPGKYKFLEKCVAPKNMSPLRNISSSENLSSQKSSEKNVSPKKYDFPEKCFSLGSNISLENHISSTYRLLPKHISRKMRLKCFCKFFRYFADAI